MVPVFSIVFIIMNMVLGIAIPFGIGIYFHKKFDTDVWPCVVGAITMLVFAFILEQGVHAVVLSSQVGGQIQNNAWLIALYGGFMAGLFEETGRFLSMKFILKKKYRDPHTALMYGVGHGGFEMALILSLGMINNLIYSLLWNMGKAEVLTNGLEGATLETVQAGFQALIDTPSYLFLLSPIERILAITAQIALSVIVWIAVTKEGELKLYFVAILLHMILDTGSAMLARGLHAPEIIVEIYVLVCAIGIVWLATKYWNEKFKTVSEE